MHTFLVIYHPHSAERSKRKKLESILTRESGIMPIGHEGWLVKSQRTVNLLLYKLKLHLVEGDHLIVVEMGRRSAAILPKEVLEWMR